MEEAALRKGKLMEPRLRKPEAYSQFCHFSLSLSLSFSLSLSLFLSLPPHSLSIPASLSFLEITTPSLLYR